MRIRPATAVPWIVALLSACTADRQPQLVASAKAPEYADSTAEFPRVRFDDGLVSVNDHCPVRKHKLNLKMPPVYVNGRPIGFC